MAATRGHLAAWDPIAHREVWRVQYSSPWNGGVLVTGGDLVFQGTTRGAVRAYQATSGRSLWSFDAHTGVVAPPVTYRIGNEQYVAVVAGWGGAFPNIAGELSWVSGKPRNRSRILAFKLGGAAELPDETANFSLPSPPPMTASEGTTTRGKKVYHRYCMFCHGDTGVSGGVLPDLRYSPLLHGAGGWSAVVRNGALESRGMIGFGAEISETDAEAIRACVILRAHESAAPTHPTPPP